MKEVRQAQHHQGKGMKQDGILAKLGRNLTEEAWRKTGSGYRDAIKKLKSGWNLVSSYQEQLVLLGDAGVGKTAVVEGFGWLLWTRMFGCYQEQRNHLVDISNSRDQYTNTVVALKKIFKIWSKKSRLWEISILFFDEIHQILGAGGTGDGQRSKGLADIIKPALSPLD